MSEDFAKYGISDSREDKRNSVYSPKVSYERRIKIISLSVK